MRVLWAIDFSIQFIRNGHLNYSGLMMQKKISGHRTKATYFLLLSIFFLSPLIAGELHDAARTGDLSKIKSYLDAGANIDELDGEKNTPLFIAAKWGKTDVVKFLVNKGADLAHASAGPFGSLGTPLHAAVGRSQLETVKVLLELGADANQPDAGAGPPLHIALSKSDMGMADLLQEYGAEPVSAPPVNHLVKSADLALGKQVSGTCSVCHHIGKEPSERTRLGPALWGVVGRDKASLDDYGYSDQMKQQKGKWTYDDLNSFISNPRAFIPGTKMNSISGISGQDRRAAIIAYLRTLSDNPYPLP
jgi:cytochrome c